jgi:hypothetical protein
MSKGLMTAVQQAELQGKTFRLIEDFRQLHGLDPAELFRFLVAFAWGYARRRGATNEEIVERMRIYSDRHELAFQRATAEQAGAVLPFGRAGQS